MFEMVIHAARKGTALGSKYGLAGLGKLNEDVVINEDAIQGPEGIVISVAVVIIVMYIVTLIVGSMSNTVATGGVNMSQNWKNTTASLDTQSQGSFTLMQILPLAIVGVGILSVIIGAFAFR
jgi:hypothetical protein